MNFDEIVDRTRRPCRCIVLAIDGARGDYLENYEAPLIQKLAKEGVGFRNAIRRVKTGNLSAWEMCIVLAKPFACGIYNPHWSEELLREMAPLYTVARW